MSDNLRSKMIRLAASMPKGSTERAVLLHALSSPEPSSTVHASLRKVAASGWGPVFGVLDNAFPRWNPNKVTDWNKVYAQFRKVTNDPGAAAHYYSEYRAGRMTQDEAIKGLQREGVRAPNV